MKALRKNGILLHINITAMEHNFRHIPRIVEKVRDLQASILLMYQLIPIGRGGELKDAVLRTKRNEQLIRYMAAAQKGAEAIMEPVAGPQYWAYLLKHAHVHHGFFMRGAEAVFHGCAAGRGFVYIKPDGEVWPCPFLEISCGNVKERPFMDIYTNAHVLKDLRDREHGLKGACGVCEYRRVCGGCRSKAWVTSGDYLAEDPDCFLRADDGVEA
jgi:radical SAM protein with 4Fe4S-binding SPASM domain